jgi:hypothetical protein
MMAPSQKHLIALGVVVLIGFVMWRGHANRYAGPAPHVAVIHDRSRSAGSVDSCSSVVGLTAQALTLPELRRGSTVTVFATGDRSTANEPVELARYELPKFRNALEGRRGAENHRLQQLADLAAKCRALPRADDSPIVLAVKRATEHLRGLGCTATTKCRVLVHTDGIETSEPCFPWLETKGGPRRAAIPAAVDNAGMPVSMCGFAQTFLPAGKDIVKAGRTARSADRMQSAWRSVFADPRNVFFSPHCPKLVLPTAPTDSATLAQSEVLQ